MTRLDNVETRLSHVEADLKDLMTRLDNVETRLSHVETDLQEIRQRVTALELVIENEIRTNIKRVAEGHLDLSRNLHNAMKPISELETLSIRVGVLESDVRELQKKIS
ncbi:MAG: hypothetical protein HDR26_07025 [Lachnospiraceae bacterium]|nr:hypothetical protein [Lachnospiraceae bacterium]